MRLLRAPLIILATITVCALAGAQHAREKKAARSLTLEGIELLESGQASEAIEKLERAYALFPNPTTGLWSARALSRSGRLVEASERYLEVGRFPLSDDAPECFGVGHAGVAGRF